MLQRGTLPISGKITFDFSEDALLLIAKHLSTQVTLKSIISFPHQPSLTAKRISVVVTEAYPAGSLALKIKSVPYPGGFFSEVFSDGGKHAFGRVRDYLNNQIIIKMGWLLLGYLDGPNKIPIMIVYVPELELGAYSFKKDSETLEEFNAQLN